MRSDCSGDVTPAGILPQQPSKRENGNGIEMEMDRMEIFQCSNEKTRSEHSSSGEIMICFLVHAEGFETIIRNS